MHRASRYLELRCRKCLWSQACGPAEMVKWLLAAGKIRPDRAMEPEILYEVFRAAADQFQCPKCAGLGMTVGSSTDDRTEWPGAAACVKCGRPIGKERLEAIPGTTSCAACQTDQEHGKKRSDKDHCPRCGAPLEVRVVARGNQTRYVMTCSANPPCPL